jgi:hypothetical protein
MLLLLLVKLGSDKLIQEVNQTSSKLICIIVTSSFVDVTGNLL